MLYSEWRSARASDQNSIQSNLICRRSNLTCWFLCTRCVCPGKTVKSKNAILSFSSQQNYRYLLFSPSIFVSLMFSTSVFLALQCCVDWEFCWICEHSSRHRIELIRFSACSLLFRGGCIFEFISFGWVFPQPRWWILEFVALHWNRFRLVSLSIDCSRYSGLIQRSDTLSAFSLSSNICTKVGGNDV